MNVQVQKVLYSLVFIGNGGNNENYFQSVTAGAQILFTTSDENDYDVQSAVEENLNKFFKNLKEANLIRIQTELHRIIKFNPNVRSRTL
ncbi:unnamed protein product [Rotaria sp. Silwood2]|nr:unnamed protein product [Rotaria sp. Silwood2]CAF4361731.1 unnamed protein product [Rotaria sp. Silwood2]CAF4406725.1 unnamed protein product [Rotaria sp. Silwood2]